MESNKNDNNNNGDNEHEQPPRNAQKRKLNELTKDEDKPAEAAGEEDKECANSKKNREEGNDMDLEIWKTSTTMADFPSSAGRHRKLPPELNCQIFYCLNLTTRRKFICGLGWDFNAMFRQSLLIKSKRVCNPQGNVWSGSNQNVTISEDGLIASNTIALQNIYTLKGFPISVADCRADGFPGTICYYYEVKTLSEGFVVGFWHGGFVFGACVGGYYTIATMSTDGRQYEYTEVPVGDRHEQNVQENVFGCGILMDPDNKLTIFFTLNGILLGKQNPISPSVDRLFPVVRIFDENVSTLEANFGDNKDKPFQYDIKNFPGMGLDCI